MSYTLHNFTAGSRFHATEANEMDAQIKDSADKIAVLQSTMDGLDELLVNKFKQKLRLTTDSDYAYLSYDNIVISSAALPLDLDDFVPCSGLTISTAPASVSIGTTAQFGATVSPIDTTQNVRWEISDMTMATITSQGVLTPLSVGQLVVTAKCGKQQQSLTYNVKRTYDLQTIPLMALNYDNYEENRHRVSISGINSSEPQLVHPLPYNISSYRIDPGRTFTMSIDSNYQILGRVRILRPLEGYEIAVDDHLDDQTNTYYINNVEQLDMLLFHARSKQDGQWGFWGPNSYTYTNNGDIPVYAYWSLRDTLANLWTNAEDPLTTAKTYFAGITIEMT